MAGEIPMHDGFGNPVSYTAHGQPILTTNAQTLQHTIPDVPSTGGVGQVDPRVIAPTP